MATTTKFTYKADFIGVSPQAPEILESRRKYLLNVSIVYAGENEIAGVPFTAVADTSNTDAYLCRINPFGEHLSVVGGVDLDVEVVAGYSIPVDGSIQLKSRYAGTMDVPFKNGVNRP